MLFCCVLPSRNKIRGDGDDGGGGGDDDDDDQMNSLTDNKKFISR